MIDDKPGVLDFNVGAAATRRPIARWDGRHRRHPVLQRDGAFYEGYDPRIKLTRTQTIGRREPLRLPLSLESGAADVAGKRKACVSSIPNTMTAAIVEGGKGPAGALKAATVPTPKPGPGEVLIRVKAAGVNRPDIIQRMGLYPPPPGSPETLGLEVAGEVAATGENVARWSIGDQVCALLGGVATRNIAGSTPGTFAYSQGAEPDASRGTAETAFTVFTNGGGRALKSGETSCMEAHPASASWRSRWPAQAQSDATARRR